MPTWYDKATSDALLAQKAGTAALTAEASRAQTAEALLAPLASPAFTGTPTIGGTTVAKTSDIAAAISNLVGAAPSALDTLKEIDDQLTADEGAAAALAATVALKAPLASPAFTGTPTIGGVAVAKTTDIVASTPVPLNALGNKLSKAGVVIPLGTTSTHDDLYAESLSPLFTAETGQIAGVYTGYSGTSGATRGAICLAWSDDGVTWVKTGPTLTYSGTGPDSNGATGPVLIYDSGLYHLFYIGLTATGYEGGIKSLCLATSPSLASPSWTRRGTIMAPGGTGWRSQNVWHPSVIKVGTTWYCFVNATGADGKERIGYATATTLTGPWTFDDVNSPLIDVRAGESIAGDPAVTRIPGGYRMDFFRVNSGFTAGWDFYATTTDAAFPLGWRVGNSGNPILSPTAGTYDAKFAHKPSIFQMGGRTYHYYTAVNASDARVVALAVDPAFPATGGTPTVTNTVAPAITGTATTGNVLTVSTGTWSVTPDSYTYTWNRAGTPISGATASTYTLVSGDVGQVITATVTAVKAGYTSGTATTGSVTPTAGSGAPAGAVAYDTFTRANSTTLGSTETGAFAWQTSGAGWAITSNTLAWTGTTDQVTMVNTGVSDNWSLQLTAAAITGAYPITFVWGSGTGTAAYSKIYRENASNGWKLATGAGANATIRNTAAPASGDVFKLSKSGGTLTLFANGTQIAQWTGWAANVSTGDTWQGIGGAGNIALTVDNFSVATP